MKRFPLMTVYRRILIGLAGLVIILAFLAGIMPVINSDSSFIAANPGGGVPGFILVFVGGIVLAVVLLVLAEFINVGLSIEDHLHALRYAETGSTARSPTPVNNFVVNEPDFLDEEQHPANDSGGLADRGLPVTDTDLEDPVPGEIEQRNAVPTPTLKLAPEPSARPMRESASRLTQTVPIPEQPRIMQTQTVPALPDAAIAFKAALSHARRGDYPAAIEAANLVLALDPQFEKATCLREECERRMRMQSNLAD